MGDDDFRKKSQTNSTVILKMLTIYKLNNINQGGGFLMHTDHSPLSQGDGTDAVIDVTRHFL